MMWSGAGLALVLLLFRDQPKLPGTCYECCCCNPSWLLCCLQIMWCFVSVIGAAMAQPHNPHQANPKLVTALQQFSWTESGLDAAIKVCFTTLQLHYNCILGSAHMLVLCRHIHATA